VTSFQQATATAGPRTTGGTNAQRKSATVASTPEDSGPTAEAREMLSAQVETALARSFPSGVAAAMTARELGKSAAAPIPANACPVHIMVMFWEVALRSSPSARTSPPSTKRRLRPKRSPTTPKFSSRMAVGRMKADVTQATWEPDAPKAAWISPLMGDGTVMHSCAAATARQQAMSVPRSSFFKELVEIESVIVRALTLRFSL
jgi:hypothetical protein